jgi:hypothetical protein
MLVALLVRCLFIPMADRSTWEGLLTKAIALIRQLLGSSSQTKVTRIPV